MQNFEDLIFRKSGVADPNTSDGNYNKDSVSEYLMVNLIYTCILNIYDL